MNIWNKPRSFYETASNFKKTHTYSCQVKPCSSQKYNRSTKDHLLLNVPSYETSSLLTQRWCKAYSFTQQANSTIIYKTIYFKLKDETLTKNFIIGKKIFKRSFTGKRASIKRAAFPNSSNFLEIKSINTVLNRTQAQGLNLCFRSKKKGILCLASEGQSQGPLIPEKSSEIQVGQGGPSIWIVKKVKSLTENLIQATLSLKASASSFNSMPLKSHDIMSNKHNKQSKISTFGLSTHYQLQKNFLKIELSLRQGCQLFTVYVFSSFCWLYLIRYSSKTHALAYSKFDFLFQDILVETLPLLSEKEIVNVSRNQNSSLTNRETINYFDYKNNVSSNQNEKLVNIELTPLFSEKLENYIGIKSIKSQKVLNSTWKKKNELLQKNDQSKSYSVEGASTLDFIQNSTELRKQNNQAHRDCKNQETNDLSTIIESLNRGIDNKSLNTESKQYKGSILGSTKPSIVNIQENKNLLFKGPGLLCNAKELIFFARKPIFIKDWSNIFPGVPNSSFFFTGKTLKHQEKEGKSYNSSENLTPLEEEKLLSQRAMNIYKLKKKFSVFTQVGEKHRVGKPAYFEQLNTNILLKKQTLTQKKVYSLSGTSMIIDPEIDFLPRKLEECLNFSKLGSCTTVTKQENLKLKEKEKEEDLSYDFKPHLSLTESLLWCKTLRKTKTEVWLNEAQTSQKNLFLNNLLKVSRYPDKKQTAIGSLFLDAAKLKSLKIVKTWFTVNSFQAKSYKLPKSFTQKKSWDFVPLLVLRPVANTLSSKNQEEFSIPLHKNVYSLASKKFSLPVTEEKLFQNIFLKKRGSGSPKAQDSKFLNVARKGKGQFIDIFNQPRLQSSFNFPNAPIQKKNKEKLKGGLGLTINPQLLFFKRAPVLTPQNSFLIEKQEEHTQSKPAVNISKINKTFSLKDPAATLSKESKVLKFTPYKTSKNKVKVLSLGSTLQSMEKESCEKKRFLEWLYEPRTKSEYLSYSRANNKLINLQKKACQFVILDKHADLKTGNCFLNFKEDTFIEKVFSYKRNSFTGLLDAPDNFFGTPYLKLGERFTIEKLESKNKMGTLYSIHSEDALAPLKTLASPYASMGTSLKTVFGKKQFTTSQNQTSKKISKVQNLITNARLVRSWAKELRSKKNISKGWSNIELKANSLFFSYQEENRKESSLAALTIDKTNNSDKNLASTVNNCFAPNTMLNKAKISKISDFKRISGKANRNITLPFKYYNPGIKRERNIEDTMLILEGYKKSRLFPTIHNDYRGIAAPSLPMTIAIDKIFYADQDVDLQSILGGMRQRTETQRIAENLSQPSEVAQPESYSENLENFLTSSDRFDSKHSFHSQEKSQEKEESRTRKITSASKHRQQNKKHSLSNYYPLLSSLQVCPQEAFPQKALGTTNLVPVNLTDSFNVLAVKSRTKDLKGSTQIKGFYFEKLLCSSFQKFPLLSFLDREIAGFLISPSFLAKILFFACTWYSYKALATPLSQSTQFLPATFTEAIGLQSFQQKYRIIKGQKTRQTFKNLAGAEKTLSELRDLIWTFRLVGTGSPNSKLNFFTLFPYIGSRFGQARSSVFSKSRNRLLLAGPPGTGKTLLVKALAAEANLPVIVQPVSSLRMISGVENPVSALFHVARQIKPCIIFLDELDTLGNDVNVSTNNYTAEQKLGIRLARKYTYTLLLELDGLTSSTRDLLIIGATNRLETLNPALTRAGRFDTILDFNLPSQEVRTALFSFYLGTTQENKKTQNQKEKVQFKKKNSSNLIRQKKKETKKWHSPESHSLLSNSKLKRSNTLYASFWLESYLAEQCYGLSHASIGTIINESALDSMLIGTIDSSLSKPLHTLETLERAINSVKALTSRAVNLNTLALKNTDVLSKASKQGSLFRNRKEKTNHLTINFKNTKEQPNKSFFAQAEPVSTSIKPFQAEFLVNRVYQLVGSLIFDKKSKQSQNFLKKTKKPFYKAASIFTKKSNLAINQKGTPINRKDIQNILLYEYSGVASLSIYTATKPSTFKILARAGLYKDPSYVAALLFTLKLLSLQTTFYTECITEKNFSGQILNQKASTSSKLGSYENGMSITRENFHKFSGFVKESHLPKVFFPETNYFNSSRVEQVASPLISSSFSSSDHASQHQPTQKSLLFWRNRKVLKNSVSSFAPDSTSFAKHNKQAPQRLLMDLKAANRLTTSWFRVYFSRPFFRYDTFNYIENKEYYPKNNYILKRNSLIQRNVSTLSHINFSYKSHLGSSMVAFPKEAKIGVNVTDSRFSALKKQMTDKILTKETIFQKGKLWNFENDQGKDFRSLVGTGEAVHSKSLRILGSTTQSYRTLKSPFFSQTKESLYLAIVAKIFHKGIEFFQKNRELTDYCAYTFLRYGVLYEFYLEAICKKF